MIRLLKQRYKVVSKYGERIHPVTGVKTFHNGIDIACPIDTPVYAMYDGVVSQSYTHDTGGMTCVFDQEDGIQLRMCHLSVRPKVGTYLKKGEIICYTGNTGRSTGAHLHIGIIKNGKRIDPLEIIK